MNYKQKLGYMALGAGILAIGIIIGQVITPDIEAQSNGVFDTITCREIEVIDKDGETTIRVQDGAVSVHGKDGRGAEMRTDEHGGRIEVYGKDGGSASMYTREHSGFVGVYYGKDGGSAGMGAREHGGFVLVRVKDGAIASMGTDKDGGFVGVHRKDGGGASMRTDEHGGRIEVANNQGKNRAVMGVNEYGTGAVSTWDKNGYRQ